MYNTKFVIDSNFNFDDKGTAWYSACDKVITDERILNVQYTEKSLPMFARNVDFFYFTNTNVQWSKIETWKNHFEVAQRLFIESAWFLFLYTKYYFIKGL